MARRGLFFLPEHSLLCRSLTLGEHLRAIEYHIGGHDVEKAVALLDIGSLCGRSPHQLTGGERPRSALAETIARVRT